MAYLLLALAVVMEVSGTMCLKYSEGFSKLYPSAAALAAYAISFYALSHCMKFLPVGVIYATWCALGIVMVCLLGFFLFGEKLDFAAVSGIGLIIAGVFLLNVVSESARG